MKYIPYLAACAFLALAGAPSFAASSVQLDFNGGAGGAADTGFLSAVHLDAAGYTLADGKLTIETLPGDIVGQYTADPDTAKNVFLSYLDMVPHGTTVVEAKVTYTGLNEDGQGGGIWFGCDTDHYVRLGVVNNSSAGGIAVEALRENEDLWTGRGGPGNDIVAKDAAIAASPLAAPLDIYLRLVRDGSTARAYYSLDGVTYTWLENYTFDSVALARSKTTEGTDLIFKAGVYAVGGGTTHAFASFDSFSATAGLATGFSASLANGTVTNHDENANGRADVGETFEADVPLAAYVSVEAPVLADKDLGRYSVRFNGTATDVEGGEVTYEGGFVLRYTGPTVTTDIESGNFTMHADYSRGDASARLTGTVTAKAGAESGTPPFDKTDFAAFNPASFDGYYAPIPGDPAHGTMRGSLHGGRLAVPIHSRKLGAAIEGSPTAAMDANGNRRVIVASGSTLYVLDPATGNDAPGWEGGRTLDGKVLGRASVLGRRLYVGTDTGWLYDFDLETGNVNGAVQPGKEGSSIYGAPAVLDKNIYDKPGIFVVVSHANGSTATSIMRLDPANLALPPAELTLSANAISVSSPAVSPEYNAVFVGTQDGFMLVGPSLAPMKKVLYQASTPTSPFITHWLEQLGTGGILKIWHTVVFVATGDGSELKVLDLTANEPPVSIKLESPLQLSAFAETWNRTGPIVVAGVADGRIYRIFADGTGVGFERPDLFSPENTGGSLAMPVEANNVVYRATEKKQILSGRIMDVPGTSHTIDLAIDLISAVRGAMAATGPQPDKDFVAGVSPDGYIHMIGVR
jgi:hypothetical protein